MVPSATMLPQSWTRARSNVVAALREEPPSLQTDERAVAQVIVDAVSLELSYTRMLRAARRRLPRGRTSPARPARGSVGGVPDVGLKILGPSDSQLLLCAETIARSDARRAGAAKHMDAAQTDAELFRSLLRRRSTPRRERPSRPRRSTCRASSRASRWRREAAVRRRHAVRRSAVRPAAARRAARCAQDRPGAVRLAKLSHHGSDNAVQTSASWATRRCSASAPGRRARPTRIATFCWSREREGSPEVDADRPQRAMHDHVRCAKSDPLARGKISDPRPNTLDAPEVAAEQRTVRVVADHQPVEVVTRIPAGVRRVVVTIDVEPGTSEPARPPPDLALAGGRQLPDLLFVTDPDGWPRTSASRRRVARWTRSGRRADRARGPDRRPRSPPPGPPRRRHRGRL